MALLAPDTKFFQFLICAMLLLIGGFSAWCFTYHFTSFGKLLFILQLPVQWSLSQGSLSQPPWLQQLFCTHTAPCLSFAPCLSLSWQLTWLKFFTYLYDYLINALSCPSHTHTQKTANSKDIVTIFLLTIVIPTTIPLWSGCSLNIKRINVR